MIPFNYMSCDCWSFARASIHFQTIKVSHVQCLHVAQRLKNSL